MASGKLKRSRLTKDRKPVLPGIGLPINVALYLFIALVLTMAIFRGWRSWLAIFSLLIVIGLLVRVRLARDRHAFRVDRLWLRTKALVMDADVWRGVTLKAFPPRPSTLRPRGIF